MTAVGNKSTVILKHGIISLSGRRAALLAIQVILPVQDVVLQSPWQRQEAHKNRRAETKATEATADPQTTEMLQTADVLCRERGEGLDTEKRSGWAGGWGEVALLSVSRCQKQSARLSFTLQPADVGPLLLLHQSRLQLGAQGHVIQVVHEDADHLAWEVLQPGDGDHLTELHWHTHTQTDRQRDRSNTR